MDIHLFSCCTKRQKNVGKEFSKRRNRIKEKSKSHRKIIFIQNYGKIDLPFCPESLETIKRRVSFEKNPG